MAFDMDNNEYIDRKEFLIFLYNTIYGLCKLLAMPLPRGSDIQEFAYFCFKMLDTNKNEKYLNVVINKELNLMNFNNG